MKKKSLFSILYSSVIWFIFCFIFQINSLDTIKNFFNKSIETAKDGYNWLTDNNKKIAKIYNNSSINEKKIKTTTLTDQTIPEIAPINLNTEDTNNTESLTEENTNKAKKNIDNTVQTDFSLFNKPQDDEKIINTYIEIITKNEPLQKEKKEELKNQIEKKIVENPKYLATIQSTVKKDRKDRKDRIIKLKKTISGKIDKKIKENSEKNTGQSPINSEHSISSPETNQKQENTKNNELKEDRKKEIAQVENLIVHTNNSKNNTDKTNQNKSEYNDGRYKEKYFHLIATIMQEYFKKDSHNNIKKEELPINNKNDTITSIKGK